MIANTDPKKPVHVDIGQKRADDTALRCPLLAPLAPLHV